uniref:Uncharacterized protein n=1 Tax=Oryza alta TaxID=52545 RepID=A0A1V1H7S1_9ORYZ|nr:hypothetical protein [Oryza alta]
MRLGAGARARGRRCRAGAGWRQEAGGTGGVGAPRQCRLGPGALGRRPGMAVPRRRLGLGNAQLGMEEAEGGLGLATTLAVRELGHGKMQRRRSRRMTTKAAQSSGADYPVRLTSMARQHSGEGSGQTA